MTRGNKYKCACCGQEYTWCEKCDIIKYNFDHSMFCCHDHASIFEILSKHGCGLTTEAETLEALKGYDTTGLTESIQAHIKSLQPKTEAKKEVETNAKKYSFKTQE